MTDESYVETINGMLMSVPAHRMKEMGLSKGQKVDNKTMSLLIDKAQEDGREERRKAFENQPIDPKWDRNTSNSNEDA